MNPTENRQNNSPLNVHGSGFRRTMFLNPALNSITACAQVVSDLIIKLFVAFSISRSKQRKRKSDEFEIFVNTILRSRRKRLN